MNNLYGWVMSEYLPEKEFNWLKNNNEFDVLPIDEKRLTGYLVEVNLKYSEYYMNYTMIIH